MSVADQLAIEPVSGPVNGSIRVPGSKSFTNRALPIAAMARGRSTLTGVLDSEDTHVMQESLGRLGIQVKHDTENHTAIVEGCGGFIPAKSAELFLANSGTSIRFLAAMMAAGHGTFVLDGIERMRQRPIGDLLTALQTLGVDAHSRGGNGCPPVVVNANGINGGHVSVRGDVSSQFLSALLMAAPLSSKPLSIAVDGELVSQPYIEMTLATMRAFGAACERQEGNRFHFVGGSGYQATDYVIEPDASSASYFLAIAAITGGTVTVEGLGNRSLQGDLSFVRELERMGCRMVMTDDATTVTGGPLHGIDTDLFHLSDTVPTMAAVACFADSPTTIRNVANIRHKETDRIAAIVTELAKTGLTVEEFDDGLTIRPGPMRGASFDTYNDHRMAMSLTLLGLRVPGVVIRDPGCTQKTYPGFFEDLTALVKG